MRRAGLSRILVMPLLITVPVGAIPGALRPLAPEPWKYVIEVNFDRNVGVAMPLSGVNKGPLVISTNCQQLGDELDPADYTLLYQKAGVQSVRFHDDGFDASLIYRGGVLLRCKNGSGCRSWPGRPCMRRGAQVADLYLEWMESRPFETFDTANYDFTAADAAYTATVNGGFETYIRLGESWDGPSHTSTPLALSRVLGQIADHFESAFGTAPPAFYEVWNEPDGLFWTGPLFHDPVARGAEFGALHGLVRDRVALHSLIPVGGNGFVQNDQGSTTGAGMERLHEVMEGMDPRRSLDYQILDTAGRTRYDFVSIHYYADGAATRPSDAVGFLDDARRAADWFCAGFPEDDAIPSPGCPIHITEWQASLDCGGTGNVCTAGSNAGFVSSMLTWMQHPGFGIERAHIYSGRGPGMGLYAGGIIEAGNLPPATCNKVLPGDPYSFNIRASALAMSLHAGLKANVMAGVRVGGLLYRADGTKDQVYKDVKEAALSDWRVTALAVSSGSLRIVVLSSMDDRDQVVTVELKGLDRYGLYQVDTKSLGDFPDTGCFISGEDRGGGLFEPDAGQLETVFRERILEATQVMGTDQLGRGEFSVRVPGHGVVRAEIRQDVVPTTLSTGR